MPTGKDYFPVSLDTPEIDGAEVVDFTVRSSPPAFDAIARGGPDVVSRWQSLLRLHLPQTDDVSLRSVVATLRDTPVFTARIRSGALGPLRYCHLHADAHEVTVTGPARPGSRGQLAIAQLSGASRITAHGEQERLGPGDMVLVHQTEDVRFEHEGRIEQLLMALQLGEAVSSLPAGLHAFDAHSPLAKLAYRWSRDSCLGAATLPSRLAGDMAEVLSRLVSCALVEVGAPTPKRTGSSVTKDGIEDYVQQRLTDPCLSVRRIAQAFGCSVRTLQRAFSRSGEPSLARYVWHKRIESCAAILRARPSASMTLTQIALDLGFSNPAHFSTLFREVLGMTPSEYRRQHLMNFAH